MARLFEGARENKSYVIKAVGLGIIFWLAQFSYQHYILIPGDLQLSVLRSAALTGAALIGIALIIGPLAKLWPSRNYIRHRRTFGVLGFTFIILHVFSVLNYSYNIGLDLYYSINPYTNPIIFGIMAFAIFMPMYSTSTDWAVEKLGFRKWKTIHRLVYFAYIFAVLHYVQVNPPLLMNPAGYGLLSITTLVFILEIAAFAKHVKEKGGNGKYVGSFIILLGAFLFYLAYLINKSTIIPAILVAVAAGLAVLYAIRKIMQKKKTGQKTGKARVGISE